MFAFVTFFLLLQPDYERLKRVCNLWRNWNDIADSFESVMQIMDYFSKNQARIQPHGGPGHWNDPDMVSLALLFVSQVRKEVLHAVFELNCYSRLVDPGQLWSVVRPK